jgi:hypothetical protein
MTIESWTLQITEDTLEELITTYTRHKTVVASYRGRPQYHHGSGAETMSADRAACWLRMVSIVEIYTEALLRHLDGEAPGKVPNGWGDVTRFLKQRHHLDVEGLTSWERYDASRLVRNAVAHGLGRFTASQLEKKASGKVRAIGIPIRDGMVVITASSLADCAETCRTFITELDAHQQVITKLGDQPAAREVRTGH